MNIRRATYLVTFLLAFFHGPLSSMADAPNTLKPVPPQTIVPLITGKDILPPHPAEKKYCEARLLFLKERRRAREAQMEAYNRFVDWNLALAMNKAESTWPAELEARLQAPIDELIKRISAYPCQPPSTLQQMNGGARSSYSNHP